MRRRARLTVASVVSLAAAAPFLPLVFPLVACDDGPMYNPAYPTEGGPTPRPPKDVDVPEDVAPAPDVVEAGTCTVPGPPIDVIRVSEDPNNEPFGGIVTDGTYGLTSAVFDSPGTDGGIAFKRAAMMKIEGPNVVWSFDTDAEGKPMPTCCAGTLSYVPGGVMVLKVTCNGEPRTLSEVYDFHPRGMTDAGPDGDAATDAAVDGGSPQLMIHVGALHDIYTKQ